MIDPRSEEYNKIQSPTLRKHLKKYLKYINAKNSISDRDFIIEEFQLMFQKMRASAVLGLEDERIYYSKILDRLDEKLVAFNIPIVYN